jgi:hypothetical protein
MPNYSPAKAKFNLKHELKLALTKIIVIAVVGIACTVAILYCTHIYYDREQALYDALVCTKGVMTSEHLDHWITNGTLLGSARLGRFVMWDGELDVAVLQDSSVSSDVLQQAINALAASCFTYSNSMQAGSSLRGPRRWRLCTSRVCAEIHEFVSTKGSSFLSSVDGRVPANQTLPLVACQVQGVLISCPSNTTYFLDAAYGTEWQSGSLTAMF